MQPRYTAARLSLAVAVVVGILLVVVCGVVKRVTRLLYNLEIEADQVTGSKLSIWWKVQQSENAC